MEGIFKIIAALLITTAFVGLFMKVANYVGERVGIYKMLQDLLRLFRRK